MAFGQRQLKRGGGYNVSCAYSAFEDSAYWINCMTFSRGKCGIISNHSCSPGNWRPPSSLIIFHLLHKNNRKVWIAWGPQQESQQEWQSWPFHPWVLITLTERSEELCKEIGQEKVTMATLTNSSNGNFNLMMNWNQDWTYEYKVFKS